MDISYMQRGCFSSPLHYPSRPSTTLPKLPRLRPIRRKGICFASSDTLVKEEGNTPLIESKKAEEFVDLKTWMHSKGLPPCKVELRDKPLYYDQKHRPIHYVVASQDLEAGDLAFTVPNSLVVTLERVLGNEQIAELLTTNKLSELACLALYLMYEKKQGKKSIWYPFIRELDRQRGRGQLVVESPLLWSEAELDYLTGSPTKHTSSVGAEIPSRAAPIFEIGKHVEVAKNSIPFSNIGKNCERLVDQIHNFLDENLLMTFLGDSSSQRN